MKRLVIGLLLVVLTACGRPESTDTVGVGSSISGELERVTTPDGLECVVYRGYQKGGVSCNWEAYNKRDEN